MSTSLAAILGLETNKIRILNITVSVEIGLYIVLALFLTYICYYFLYKHKFYKEKHLLFFYVQAYAIIIFRLA